VPGLIVAVTVTHFQSGSWTTTETTHDDAEFSRIANGHLLVDKQSSTPGVMALIAIYQPGDWTKVVIDGQEAVWPSDPPLSADHVWVLHDDGRWYDADLVAQYRDARFGWMCEVRFPPSPTRKHRWVTVPVSSCRAVED